MKINNETKIGIMVAVVAIMLIVLTVKTGDFNLISDGYPIKVHFDNIDGVNLNSPVMYNGFEVGVVEDIIIRASKDDIKMELILWIDKKARLRQGSKAYVKNLGFMGEKYVGLTSGDPGSDFLKDGDIIEGQEPPNFDELMRDGKDIAGEVKEVVEVINERLQNNKNNVDEILSNLNTTMKNLSSILENTDERLEKNKQEIDEIISNLKELSVNLEELSYDLKLHPWKILHKTKEKKKE